MRRPGFATFSRYRPRVLTLVVLFVTAALISLANLSDVVTRRKVEDWARTSNSLSFVLGEPAGWDPTHGYHGCWNMSSGWPLIWRQYVFMLTPGPGGVVGQCHNICRLIANMAVWLALLAAAAGGSEWLLRRHRPRLRWSLRTMLAAIGLAAASCAWFAAARNRAILQDPVIDAKRREVWGERWGPKWLDVVGADRFRRRIVGVDLRSAWSTFDEVKDQQDEELLKRLAGLPDLEYLFVQVERLTPEMVSALDDMRGLRILYIEQTGADAEAPNRQSWRAGFAAIGKMKQIEELHLQGISFASESLAHLDGLAELKSLSLEAAAPEAAAFNGDSLLSGAPLLSHLPALPRLESLNLSDSDVGDSDLHYLAALPRLRSLDLSRTKVTHAGLPELASLNSLEELMIAGELVSVADLDSLRRSKPGIVIDNDVEDRATQEFGQRTISPGHETIPAYPETWLVNFLRQWKRQAGKN